MTLARKIDDNPAGWIKRIIRLVSGIFTTESEKTWISMLSELKDAWRHHEPGSVLRHKLRSRFLVQYGLAVVGVLAALAVHICLSVWVGGSLPYFILFFPAVTIVTLLVGWGPGLVATGLSLIIANHWLMQPIGASGASAVDRLALVLFAFNGSLLTLVTELYRRNRQKVAAYEREARVTERLKRVLEVETVGVMFWDVTSGRMTDANDAFLRLIGYSRREMEAGGLTWQTLTPPEYVEASVAEIRKFKETGHIGPYEKEYFRKDGTRFWLLIAGTSLGDNTCVEFCVDISAWKKAEVERRQTEETLRQRAEMLRLSFDAIIVWRLDDGSIESWNRGAEELYGFTETEARGRHTHDLLHTVHPVPWQEVLAALKAHGRWEGDLIHHARDGREVMISCRKLLIHGAECIDRVLETNRDITDRKKAESQLEASLHELRDTQKELMRKERLAVLGKLAGSVAHEIRTPLAVIRNSVVFLESYLETGDETIRDVLAEMNRAVGNSNHIISEMLDYVREPTSLSTVFQVGDAISNALREVPVPDSIRVESSQPGIAVTGNPDQVKRILLNLIQNAVQAMPQGGDLQVSAHRLEDGKVSILVRDSGCGIPEGNLDKIFEPLFSTKTKGIGLGLAIARRYARLNGGDLSVESELGRGTTFRLMLRAA